MTDAVATLNGANMTSLELIVPPSGLWVARAKLDQAAELSGEATLSLSGYTVVGTIVASRTGTYVETSYATVIGGKGKMDVSLPRKDYHNDAGVKVRTIVEDILREAGETMGTWAHPVDRTGYHYCRVYQPLGWVLEGLGVQWRADLDASTLSFGPRPTAKTGAYELLAWDPISSVAELGVDRLDAIQVGSVVDDTRLRPAMTVREYCASVTPGSVRVRARLFPS